MTNGGAGGEAGAGDNAGAGAGDNAGAGAGAGAGDNAGAGTGDNAGAGAGDNAGAGAGGADACEGQYLCPSVFYWSHATIKVDLPVSVTDAADAVFTACRNDECYSAKGSAKVDTLGPSHGEDETLPEEGWVATAEGGGGAVFLSFDGSGLSPFAVLDWRFSFDGPAQSVIRDHYSLTIQPVAEAATTTLFDGDVSYTIIVADPSLVGEGYCRHCSEVVRGAADARTGQ